MRKYTPRQFSSVFVFISRFLKVAFLCKASMDVSLVQLGLSMWWSFRDYVNSKGDS